LINEQTHKLVGFLFIFAAIQILGNDISNW
jgi:hypothetical protein